MIAEWENGSPGVAGAGARDARRARLRAAMLSEVAQGGYANAKIRQIARRARVSTKTFYALYPTKEQCFVEALAHPARSLERHTAQAIASTPPQRAASSALVALAQFATRQTDAFYALTHEALFAPAPAVAARERLFTALHARIEQAVEQAPARAEAPDIPALILISGAIRLLGIARRRGGLGGELAGRLTDWAACYAAPCAAHRWRTFSPQPALLSPGEPVDSPSSARPGEAPANLLSSAVKHAQREQLLLATAEVVYTRGYAKTTVPDIVAASGLSRDLFYAHFRGKQQAFVALVSQIYEQVMGACARAFFTSERPWPERVWDAGETMARLLAANPRLAYAALAESGYVLGPAVMDADEMILGFTVFLEDGYGYRPAAADNSRVLGEAIAGATLETINRNVRHDRAHDLPGWLPLITYLTLAPFTGVQAASDFVDQKVAEYRA